MKTVNERAEPVMAKLAEGEWWRLSEDERSAVASWATMFTMTYEFADIPTLATPFTERSYLRTERQPPPNWWVMVARYDGGPWSNSANHKGVLVSNDLVIDPFKVNSSVTPHVNTQFTVFTFGKTLLATFSTRADANFNIAQLSPRLGLQPIWPLDGKSIEKPLAILTDREVAMAAHWLDLVLAGPEWSSPIRLADWEFNPDFPLESPRMARARKERELAYLLSRVGSARRL